MVSVRSEVRETLPEALELPGGYGVEYECGRSGGYLIFGSDPDWEFG
jgi:hypothetical protein